MTEDKKPSVFESNEQWKGTVAGTKPMAPMRMRADTVLETSADYLRDRAEAMLILADLTRYGVACGKLSEKDEAKLWHLYNQMR